MPPILWPPPSETTLTCTVCLLNLCDDDFSPDMKNPVRRYRAYICRTCHRQRQRDNKTYSRVCKICSVEFLGRNEITELCSARCCGEYGRQIRMKDRPLKCVAQGCDKPVRSLDYCEAHVSRLRKHGDVFEEVPLGATTRFVDLETKPTCLYAGLDARAKIIYLGIACDAQRRWHQHKRSSFFGAVDQWLVLETHPDRASAKEAETAAILKHRPIFNKSQNPDYDPAVCEAYLADHE